MSEYHTYSIKIEDQTVRFITARSFSSTVEPHQPIHQHAYGEFFCCISGSLILRTRDTFRTLHTNELLFIPSQYPHILEGCTDDTVWCSFLFCVSPSPAGNRTLPALSFVNTDRPFLHSCPDGLLQRIYNLCTKPQNASAAALMLYAELLSLSLPGDYSPFGALPEEASLLADLELVITSRYRESLSLKETASLVHISPKSLERLLRKHYHKSFHQIITDQRMDASRQLLLNSNKTVEQIAQAVGFNNTKSFYRCWKEYESLSPSAFRREGKG